jgi:hypothetical protein
MWADAELNPRGRVLLGLVAAALNPLEHAVVLLGAACEVVLDGAELRRDEALARKDERLDDSGDPPVPVTERMNTHDVKVCHSRSDHDVMLSVSAFEPVDNLVHQRGDVFAGGTGVRRRPASGRANEDRPCAPEARRLVALEQAGVEVKIQDDAVQPAKLRVEGHRPDVVHRACVRRNCHAVGVIRVWLMCPVYEGGCLTMRNREPLDRDRTLDGVGPDLAA